MKLNVNGNEIERDGQNATVKEILTSMRYSFPMVIVKVNEVVVPRDAYDSTQLKDGDKLDAYHLVSGG